MDRNKEAQMRAAMAQFAGAVAGGQAAILDRFGSKIKVGNLVVWRPPFDLIFKCVDVKPILDPRVQAGMIQMVFEVEVPVTGLANAPNMGMIICGESSADDRHTDLTGAKPEAPPTNDAPGLIQLTDAPEIPSAPATNVTPGVFGANRGDDEPPATEPTEPLDEGPLKSGRPEPAEEEDDDGPKH